MLSTRGRKDVTVASVKVQVLVFAFDCLYLNGEALLKKPLTERRAVMEIRDAMREIESANPGRLDGIFGELLG